MWKKIETAPKDGRILIGWHPNWSEPTAIRWSEKHQLRIGGTDVDLNLLV